MGKNKRGIRTREAALAFVEAYYSTLGYPPTVREVMSGVGLASPGSTHYILRSLEADGLLTNTARGFMPARRAA